MTQRSTAAGAPSAEAITAWRSLLPLSSGKEGVTGRHSAVGVREEERRIEALTLPVLPLGRTEFMADIANTLPLQIICDIIGVPAEDATTLATWSLAANYAFSPLAGAHRHDAECGIRSVLEYVRGRIKERRKHPRHDLITELAVRQTTHGSSLSETEISIIIANIVVAGHDTTRSQLGIAMWLPRSAVDGHMSGVGSML